MEKMILERIKDGCSKHKCTYDCPFWDDFNEECIIRNKPNSWDIEEIKRRLNDGQTET